jgi:hypothetical protein
MKLHLPAGTFEDKVLKPLDAIIKEDPRYKKQLVYAYLGADLDPYNLGSMAPSSEGKTYPAVQVASIFPQKNILYLGGLSPTAIVHDHGVLTDGSGNSIEERVNELTDRIEEEESRLADAHHKEELKNKIKLDKDERKSLFKEARYLIDLTGKVLLFLEPPHHETWARLKPILSHDKYEIEFRITEKTKKGQLCTNHIIIRGFPVSVFCSAKDEQSKWSMWEEIQTRHEITSPNMALQKYLAANKLSSTKKGLPQTIVDRRIDRKSLQEAQEYLGAIISRIKDIQRAVQDVTKEPYPNLSFIPFVDLLADAFPHDSGSRMREYSRLLAKINVIAFAHMNQRAFILIDKLPFIIASIYDLKEAIDITALSSELPPFKLRFYYDIFIPALEQKYLLLQDAKGKQSTLSVDAPKLSEKEKNKMLEYGLTAKELEEFMLSQNRKLSAKKIYDRYLMPLDDHGILRAEKDKENERRNVYYPETLNGQASPQIINIDDITSKLSFDYLQEQYQKLSQNATDIEIEFHERKLDLEELYRMIIPQKECFELGSIKEV